MRINVLLAEDEVPTRALMTELLQGWRASEELNLVTVASPEAALEAAGEYAFAIALLDLHYEGSLSDGFALLKALRAADPRIELVVLSSASTFAAVQEALRSGANDYLTKGFGRGDLYHVLDKALERRRWRQIESRVKEESAPAMAMAGSSAAMKQVAAAIRKYGASRAPVLIFGETGTGKELAARGLHACGADPAAPFVAVNCAAVPGSTADSFFFGHERGAFTGADRAKAGVFEEAEGGTIFLDEINSLPLEMQGRLLRVLEQKEIRRLGGARVVPVDFRLLAATNGDLEQMVEAGTFREDLFYRLNTLQLLMPPLRERSEDLPALASLFQPQRKFSHELWEMWAGYSWPGNIREFRNLLLAMDALADPTETLSVMHIPEHLLRRFSAAIPDGGEVTPDNLPGFADAQAQRETEFLRRAYRSAGANVSRMARVLGADRSHLHQKLVKLGIHQSK